MIINDEHIEFELTKPQLEFYKSKKKFVAMVAGFGAGKTNTGILALLDRIYEYPTIDWLWVEPTLGLVKDIFYPCIEEILTEQRVPYKINKSDNIVYIENHGKIFCRSMDRPARMVGFKCGDAFLDEFDTEKKEKALDIWRKVLARIRQPLPAQFNKDGSSKFGYDKKGRPIGRQNQIRIMTTPEGFRATYQIFVEDVANFESKGRELVNNGFEEEGNELINESLKYQIVHASTYSNEHNLSPGYIDAMKNAYPEELIDAYLDAKFVNLTSGTVYRSFDRNRNFSYENVNGNEPLHVGMDFNVMKMSAVVHVLRDGIPHAVREVYKRKDTPDMIVALKELFPHNHITVYPDASSKNRSTENAGSSDLKLLRAAGFTVVVDNSNPRIKDRVISMNANFCNANGASNYFINISECKNYVACLEKQAYDGNGLPEKTGDLDHLPDAGGYFIHKKFGVTKQQIIKRVMRGW